MNDQPDNTDKKNDTDSGFISLIARAEFDIDLLLFKAVLVMNSGALMSILISVSRSDDGAISVVLIDAAFYFGLGLTAVIIGLVFHYPYTAGIKGLEEYSRVKSKFGIIVSAFSLLFSIGVFLYGTWKIIYDVRGVLTALSP